MVYRVYITAMSWIKSMKKCSWHDLSNIDLERVESAYFSKKRLIYKKTHVYLKAHMLSTLIFSRIAVKKTLVVNMSFKQLRNKKISLDIDDLVCAHETPSDIIIYISSTTPPPAWQKGVFATHFTLNFKIEGSDLSTLVHLTPVPWP